MSLSLQTECFNFIRFLQPYNASHLYVCGTYAFQPKCAYIVSAAPSPGAPVCPLPPTGPPLLMVSLCHQDMLTFTLERGDFEDGKGKCPYDPAKGHTGLLVGKWLSWFRLGK